MPIDPKVCDLPAAIARMGGRVDILRQVVRLHRDDAPGIMARLREAIASNDSHGAQLAAHSLKGLVVNFGADACAQAAARVEVLGAGGNLSEAGGAVRDLERQLARLDEALTTDLANIKSGPPIRPNESYPPS